MAIEMKLSDVRNASDQSDYVGQVLLSSSASHHRPRLGLRRRLGDRRRTSASTCRSRAPQALPPPTARTARSSTTADSLVPGMVAGGQALGRLHLTASRFSTPEPTATSLPPRAARRPAAPATRSATSSRARSRPDRTLVSITASPVRVRGASLVPCCEGSRDRRRSSGARSCSSSRWRSAGSASRSRAPMPGVSATRSCTRSSAPPATAARTRCEDAYGAELATTRARPRAQHRLRAAQRAAAGRLPPLPAGRLLRRQRPGGARSRESAAGLPVTAFTRVVDRRPQGGRSTSSTGSTSRRASAAASDASSGRSRHGWPGYPRRRLGGLCRCRIAPDGRLSARATAHGGYTSTKHAEGWGRWTGWYRVSGGSHAGHLVDGRAASARRRRPRCGSCRSSR